MDTLEHSMRLWLHARVMTQHILCREPLSGGVNKIAQKVGEEATEVVWQPKTRPVTLTINRIGRRSRRFMVSLAGAAESSRPRCP